jgi:outer membrane protein assembly factor BamA
MGNLRLEANVEYRFPLYQILKGAVFMDAGNVWNTENNYAEIEGDPTEQQELLLEKGVFEQDFISELGIGAGVGLRIDIQNFVIRFDLAAPLHTPWYEEGERWDFRISDPVFNFAIGYPF